MGFLEIAANRGAAAQLTGCWQGNEVSIILGEAAAAAGFQGRVARNIPLTYEL
jgi:hypothetical protein